MGPSMSWREKILKKRYRLDDRIAVGRTVEVFRGYDLIENRDVAIKQPLPHLLSDRDFCDSFRAASVRAVRLRNPGLVEVLDYGLEEERPFVVMELVKEKSLNEILTNGRKMKSLGGMYFAINVGRTLAYLHEQGVTHGSLDERHIFILPGRAAKLSDPGFPTVLGGASTPYPFSQDPRRDIQDFGYLLYRSLTGKDKDEAAEDVKKGKLQLDPEMPERERRFVQLCLESSGSGGFASAEQMVWQAVTILREEQPMVDVSAAASVEEEVEEEAEAPHPFTLPQLKRWQIVTGTWVLVVAAVFFLVWILSTIIAPSKVQVPNLVNMSVEEARKVADANDLGLLVVDKTYDADVKTNYIISQSPPGGEMVKKKTLIQVLESLGPLTVPNLVGLSLDDARTVLDSRGFKVGEISYREVSDFTPNHVLETDPPYGAKLSSGAAVNLVVSKSP
jgi:eukaryotic-like serine/threonine-protein kinase